jgi:hypothetical protein
MVSTGVRRGHVRVQVIATGTRLEPLKVIATMAAQTGPARCGPLMRVLAGISRRPIRARHTSNRRRITGAGDVRLDLIKPARLAWLWVWHHFDHHLGFVHRNTPKCKILIL